ncbi:hypothetical protein HDU93_006636 [Gonapodya sp. JEL0774]|nr:hypothetical protein HDU93_006636 [Gonapodya sp. JEL0774]
MYAPILRATILDTDESAMVDSKFITHPSSKATMNRVARAANSFASNVHTVRAVLELKGVSVVAAEMSGSAADGLKSFGEVAGRGFGEALMGGAEIVAKRGKTGRGAGIIGTVGLRETAITSTIGNDSGQYSKVGANGTQNAIEIGTEDHLGKAKIANPIDEHPSQSISAVRTIARSTLSAFLSVTSSLDSLGGTLLASAEVAGSKVLHPRAQLVDVDGTEHGGGAEVAAGGMYEVGKNAFTTYGNAVGGGIGGLVKGLGQGFLEGLGTEKDEMEDIDSDDDEDVLFKSKKTKKKNAPLM